MKTNSSCITKIFVFILVIFVTSCASSSKNEKEKLAFSNLVKVQKPQQAPQESSSVYIDSVKQITNKQKQVLLIYGTFPDGCTKLEVAKGKIVNDALQIHFEAWRNPQMMCTQVLTPFSFLYNKFSRKAIDAHSEVIINGSVYRINK